MRTGPRNALSLDRFVAVHNLVRSFTHQSTEETMRMRLRNFIRRNTARQLLSALSVLSTIGLVVLITKCFYAPRVHENSMRDKVTLMEGSVHKVLPKVVSLLLQHDTSNICEARISDTSAFVGVISHPSN